MSRRRYDDWRIEYTARAITGAIAGLFLWAFVTGAIVLMGLVIIPLFHWISIVSCVVGGTLLGVVFDVKFFGWIERFLHWFFEID